MSKELKDYLFYHEPGPPEIKIYNSSCLEIMQLMPSVDLVLTDPPYGLGKKIHDGGTWSTDPKYDAVLEWDVKASDETISKLISIGKNCIIWGGHYYHMEPSRCWLIWKKLNSVPTMADCELAWTNFDMPSRVFDYRIHPDGVNIHPTQKPLALMKWSIQQCKYWDTPLSILDPFGGSGTTAVACKELRKDCTLIEISEKYCQIAKVRLQNTIVPMF